MVSTSLSGALLSALGGVLAAVVTYLGVRHTQRQAAKAQQATSEIEHHKVEAIAYGEARQIWDALIKDLRAEVSQQRLELRHLRTRMEDLEQKRAGDRQAIHILTVYARQLLQLLKAHNVAPPAPPVGLDLDGEPWKSV